MSIFRCNKCAFIKEVPQKHLGRVANCPKCGSEAKVVDTVSFTTKIITAYTQKQNEISTCKKNIQKAKEYIDRQNSSHQDQLTKLQKDMDNLKKQNSSLNSKYSKSIDQHKKDQEDIKTLQNNIQKLQKQLADKDRGVENISHDKEFDPEDDYKPIVDWFAQSNIKATIDRDAVDTRGFFDEVAITLGNNFDVLESVLEQMRYIQRKGYDTVKISLEQKDKREISIIKNFCKEIYDYSFASRYFLDKKKNAIYLEIQKATKITNFFNGIWMEWYVYMMLLDRFEKQELPYTLLKGLKITYSNKDKNELDIFFVIGDTPVCIECKSGEFRKDIDKYVKLKKRLKLGKEYFIICAIGLDTLQTDGLTNTFDITFTNQNNLLQYIDDILRNISEHKDRISNINKNFMNNKTKTKKEGTIDSSDIKDTTDETRNNEEKAKKGGFLSGIISPFKK